MKPNLILGLSGGVDSAVSAALLREHYDVTCVFLDIGLGGGEAAAALADSLSLPFRTMDIRDKLEHFVCADFQREYLAGRTPLPCARCNPLVKFPALLEAAEALGAQYVATGHYARTAAGPGGRTLLRKGMPANDQSYMLARLTQTVLHRVVFPLGGYEKTQVRALAEELGLSVAKKPDSMEICFIPDGDYAAWLDGRGETPPPGDFIDKNGKVLVRHGSFANDRIIQALPRRIGPGPAAAAPPCGLAGGVHRKPIRQLLQLTAAPAIGAVRLRNKQGSSYHIISSLCWRFASPFSYSSRMP